MNYDHAGELLEGQLEEYAGGLLEGELGEYQGVTFLTAAPYVDTPRRNGRSEKARICTQILAHSIGLLATVPYFDRPNEMALPSPEYLEIQRKYARSDIEAIRSAEAKRERRQERNRQNRPIVGSL